MIRIRIRNKKQQAYIEKRDRCIDRVMYKYGSEIIASPIFQQMKEQIHHHHISLYDHVMAVTRESIRLGLKCQARGKKVDMQALVIGALCHDLGMVGRYDRYKNNMECCRLHPVNSVAEAERLIGPLDEKTAQVIRGHMWPLSPLFPHSLEAKIVIHADKCMSIRQFFSEGFAFRRKRPGD